ncbi:MAG: DUF2079 domain-containing protein [Cyanobium sp.]
MLIRSAPWTSHRTVVLAAGLFAGVGLLLQGWRLQSLTASYDQGIFLQVLWNGLHGHLFESTLSSQLSTNVVHGGQLPQLGYHRLGQHFTPTLALWIPLVGMLGALALPLVQVGLMTAAGLLLHRLALEQLKPATAATLTVAFFGANAVVGPTWGNFTDLCQLPLLVVALVLGLRQRRPWLVGVSALLIPLIREDTGVLLVGVGLWLWWREAKRWPLALGLILYGSGWIVLVTNVLMPLFSEDNTRRFMIENFGQYVPGTSRASSLDVLQRALQQPVLLLRELVHPPLDTLRYLISQGLPLLFIPLISVDAWLLMGLPLLGLLLAQGNNNPLSINIRYALLVVPGLFLGALCWWEQRPQLQTSRRLRRLWQGCIGLSLLFALMANPNRSLSFVIPDSVHPWVYASPAAQWRHGQRARQALAVIPSQASVSASTHLVPQLAQRQVLVRFPNSTAYLDRDGLERPVDWVAVDLNWLERNGKAFDQDREALEESVQWLRQPQLNYAPVRVLDGVVVLQRHAPSRPEPDRQLQVLLSHLQGAAQQNDAPDP